MFGLRFRNQFSSVFDTSCFFETINKTDLNIRLGVFQTNNQETQKRKEIG